MINNPTTATEQFELAKKYFYSEGAQQDQGKAVFWFTKAAKQGHAEAQRLLDSLS